MLIPQQNIHTAHGLFALVHVLRLRSISFALLVVFLYPAGLFAVQEYTNQSRVIFNRHGDAVFLRLQHGVLIHHFTEYMDSLVNGGSGESHVCGIGQGIAQILGKAV